MPVGGDRRAAGQPPSSTCIGISGDGDTANIGLGQFKHACRRNLPMVYIVEDNGCYGLTKGQFSATADLNAHLRRATGEENPIPPFDLCLEAIVGGATFVARSFAGDKKQLVPLLKAALAHGGTAVLDIISPCVTFNDFAELDQELGLGQGARGAAPGGRLRPPPGRDRGRAEGRRADPRPASRRLLDHPSRPQPRGARRRQAAPRPSSCWTRATKTDEFLTGLLYVDPDRADFVTAQHTVDTPLALLPDDVLRPSAETLSKIMETI